MPLTYDQKSEIRIAFDEAYVPPDRRRDFRVKYRVDAEICPWQRGRQGDAFKVRLEDFSPTGVGVIHAGPMDLGNEYLLKVPRPGQDELVVLLSVVRCVRQDDGSFLTGMELSSVMDRSNMGQFVDALKVRRRITSRRTKVLFILLGIFSLSATMFI